MEPTRLHIKNMVCNRCITAVDRVFTNLGYTIRSIDLGEVEIEEKLFEKDLERLKKALEEEGFELIADRRSWLINQIKTLIIEYIHYGLEKPDYENFSEFLAKELGHDYSYLSHLFSLVEGRTIEKYMILQRIEKAKELLVYDELSINEVAYKLGYSSVQHLSRQFKNITGLTPSHYREIKENKRKPLDSL